MQSLSRLSVSLIVGVLVAAAQAPASAADYFVKNDSLGENFTGKIASAELVADEMYVATFELPASWTLPVELEGVRVVMVDGDDASKTYCGRFAIEVWEESSSAPQQLADCPYTRTKDPGPVIYSMSTQFQNNPIGFEVKGDSNNAQDLRFSAINNNQSLNATINPVMLNTRRVRVGIKALDNQCSLGGNAFPVMVTDDSGVDADNFLYGKADVCGQISGTVPPPEFYYWADFAQFFSAQPGDFVMRLIFDRPLSGGGDVGVDAGTDAGMDVGVDVGPDAGADIGGSGDIGSDLSSGDDTSAAGPAITSVSPSSVPNDASTDIAIVGSGFETGAQVLLGAEAIGVLEVRSGLIRATVPEGLALGSYDILVSNPDGATAVLPDALTVVEPGASEQDAGAVADTGAADSGTQSDAAAQAPLDDGGAAEEGCACHTITSGSSLPSSLLWTFALFAGTFAVLRRHGGNKEMR